MRPLGVTIGVIAAWDAFALSILVLAWLGIFFTDARKRVREAKLEDSSRVTISVCLVLASLVSLFGAGILLGTAKDLRGLDHAAMIGNVALAAVTIIFSWLLVHTLLAVHYAHIFYSSSQGAAAAKNGAGLAFPEENAPSFMDFAYFSFVIGMTFQVSDVEVTSRQLRRTVLGHSLLSFAFNTVIVAFSINLAATLL